MFTFAGSFTTPKGEERKFNIDSNWKHIQNEGNDRVIHYIAWITDVANSAELINYIAWGMDALMSYDISHTGDADADVVELRMPKTAEWTYYCVAYHGQRFDQVVSNGDNVLSIRTAEASKHIGWKVIKVDMIQ